MDCIFCKIVNKEILAKLVFESDTLLAFRDIAPVAPSHILIVPKVHLQSISEITPDNVAIIGEIHLAANEIARNEGIESFRLITNHGAQAGQSVFHLHYHLIGGKEIPHLI